MENIKVHNFNSIHELVSHLKGAKQNFKVFTKKTPSSQSGDKSFTGTQNYTEALDLITNGWDSGTKELLKGLNLANAKPQPKEVQRAIFDIVGFQASVPRLLQGIPTNMVNKKNVKQKQKIVTLVKSISYSAQYSSKDILDDSVKFLQLVQSVEKKGFRVNAYTIWNSQCGSERIICRVKIKSASERLNISKISFPLMHPSFLRRLMFKLLETTHEFKQSWQYGYGRPDQNCQPYLNKDEYYVPVNINEFQMKQIFENIK